MKKIKAIWSLFFIIALLVIGVLIVFGESIDFSEMENRYLAKAPSINGEKVLSGDFQSELADFLQDQFPGRDEIMKISTSFKKAEGLSDINQVYLGKDGYYITKVLDKDIDFKLYENNLDRIEKFASDNKGIEVIFMPVPSKECVLSEKLPAGAKTYSEDVLYGWASKKNFTLVDLRDTFSKADHDNLYYKTDHHWTTKGAYLAYRTFAKSVNNVDTPPYAQLKIQKTINNFYGTLYSKTMDINANSDAIQLVQVPKTKVYTQGKEISLYDYDCAKAKDKYKVFQGGNYGLVSINNQGLKGKSILIIKDSFANSFVPHIIKDYENVYMIDLRYYSGSISSLIKDKGIKQVLFLYELSGFAESRDLAKLAFYK